MYVMGQGCVSFNNPSNMVNGSIQKKKKKKKGSPSGLGFRF
jgi:hypothetical protein